jgi:hypothetical protein
MATRKNRKGKSTVRITLKKGLLKKHGYVKVATLSKESRHQALASAVKEYGSLTTWRMINVLSIFFKNTNPSLAALYNSDKVWIKKEFGLTSR